MTSSSSRSASSSTETLRLLELHGAVIDASSFATQKEAIEEAKAHAKSEVVVGGGYDDSKGYFVEPTVIRTEDPDFGSSATSLRPRRDDVRLPGRALEETLELIDDTAHACSPARFAGDREAEPASDVLRYTAGTVRERQAHRRQSAAAVRRRARLRHERQGRLHVEPDPLGEPADDQGDLRAAAGLPLPFMSSDGG